MHRALTVALALVAAAPLSADDARSRRARVALALAARPAAEVAPMPRAGAHCYARGFDCALERRLPLVVFVSCAVVDVDAPAVVAKADTLAGVDGPAVVVAVPAGNRLLQDAVIPCPASPADVERAVKAAARKVDGAGKGMTVAPRPLLWEF